MFPFGGGGGMGGMPMMGGGMGMNSMMGSQGHPELSYVPDTSERINIAPLPLLKMLKHCKYSTQTFSFDLMITKMDELVRSLWHSL